MINKDEMLFVVDEDNNPVEPMPRSIVHAQGLWHRTTSVWVMNHQKLILCDRRSIMKENDPEMWEANFGGHMAPGEDYLDNAVTELAEEIGIKARKEDLREFGICKSDRSHSFEGNFVLLWDGNTKDLKLEEEEVEEVAWFEVGELRKIFGREDDDWVIQGHELEVLEWLENLE